jgi:hypothetical protein
LAVAAGNVTVPLAVAAAISVVVPLVAPANTKVPAEIGAGVTAKAFTST